jgi:hypothetical protein
MGTKVLQRAAVNASTEDVANLLADLLEGRNIAPTTMYEKYVVAVKKDGNALLVEVDDLSVYRVAVEKIS